MSRHEKDENIELSTPELQAKYLEAKAVSDTLLKKLDLISMDIRRVETFLQKSGFGAFIKTYETASKEEVVLHFDSARLRFGKHVLIETKVKDRLQAHAFLPDFLESISKYHVNIGDKK